MYFDHTTVRQTNSWNHTHMRILLHTNGHRNKLRHKSNNELVIKASLQLLIHFGSEWKYSMWRDIHSILTFNNNFEIKRYHFDIM